MSRTKPGATRGGKREGAGAKRKGARALTTSITVALTPETVGEIDAEVARLKEEMPEATVGRTTWVRAAIMAALAVSRGR